MEFALPDPPDHAKIESALRQESTLRNRLHAAACVAVSCALVACKGTEPLTPTSIVVTPAGALAFSALTLTQKLKAKVLDQHGDSMPGLAITWTTGSAAVATVDTAGLVTAKGNGSTSIKATSGGAHQDVPCTVAQVASLLAAIAGNGQVSTVASALPVPL